MNEAYFLHERLSRSDDVMRRVAALSVTVCGAGALGSNITENLARGGFTYLRVIDRDRIEERNLSTQPYYRSDVGAYKSTILSNTLFRALRVQVDGRTDSLDDGNVRKLLGGSGLVVDTFDNSPSRQLVTDFCRRMEVPCLHVGLAADYAEVVWNAVYRVPSAAQDDICDYPLSRNLVMLTAAVAAETIVRFAAHGAQQSWTITMADMRILPFRG
jgi:molybdopterin/thiamine biosynthesis adenylyltransferase